MSIFTQSLQCTFHLIFSYYTLTNSVLFKPFLYVHGYTLYHVHERGGAGCFQIRNLAIFIRKSLCISVKLRINPYTWRHCSPIFIPVHNVYQGGVCKVALPLSCFVNLFSFYYDRRTDADRFLSRPLKDLHAKMLVNSGHVLHYEQWGQASCFVLMLQKVS